MHPFWTSILAFLLLKERIKAIEILGILICFGGVIMIGFARQERIDEKEAEAAAKGETDDEEEVSQLVQNIGLGLGLLSAMTMAVNSVYNRKLKNIDYFVVMCYHGILGSAFAIVYICIEAVINGEFRIYTFVQYLILIAASVMDMLTVNCMTIAFQRDSSGFVSLISYALIFYGFLSDVIIFNEKIMVLEVIGAIIILVSTMTVATIKLCETYRQKQKQISQVAGSDQAKAVEDSEQLQAQSAKEAIGGDENVKE